MSLIGGLLDAISLAFGMFWEILWALVLGFALSAAVQAVVSKAEMTRLCPQREGRIVGKEAGHLRLGDNGLHGGGEGEAKHQGPEYLPEHPEGQGEGVK